MATDRYEQVVEECSQIWRLAQPMFIQLQQATCKLSNISLQLEPRKIERAIKQFRHTMNKHYSNPSGTVPKMGYHWGHAVYLQAFTAFRQARQTMRLFARCNVDQFRRDRHHYRPRQRS
jgi:hypothetical protein